MTDYPGELDEPPTFAEDDWTAFGEQEHRFYAAVRIAVDRHQDNPKTMTMRCPICKNRMDVVRRSRRLTFGGWEDACIQVNCETCIMSGEIGP